MLASENGRKLVGLMPKERILTESDGPFAQLAGKAIKPWEVANAIEALARIWSVPIDGASDQLEDNLQRLTMNEPGKQFA